MITDEQINNLRNSFKRILSMAITRSTYREIQNAIMTTLEGNQEFSNHLLESLLTGKIKDEINNKQIGLKKFVDEFFIATRVAKDVHDRGDFLSIATSDLITQQNQVVFFNRIRRIDGEEFHFLTDPDSTVRMLEHYLGRVMELARVDNTKNFLKAYKDKLSELKMSLDNISSNS